MNMATTHPVAPEEIMALVDGELPADHAQAITTHLDHCAECAEIAEQMRATSQDLSRWAIEDAPQGWDESMQKRAEEAASEGKPRKPAKTTDVLELARVVARRSWRAGVGADSPLDSNEQGASCFHAIHDAATGASSHGFGGSQ
jgi:anti-sigma factor RsiW